MKTGDFTKTRVRSITVKIPKKKADFGDVIIAELLAQEYILIKEAQDALDERKETMQAKVRENLVNGRLEASQGTFTEVERNSYSWSLDAIRLALLDQHQAFLAPDNALLRIRMKTADEAGAMLTASATVSTSHAITFKKS